MATSIANRGPKRELDKAAAQAKIIDRIRSGSTVDEACAAAGRSAETYRMWRRDEPEFKREIDAIRSMRASDDSLGKQTVPDFPTFCREWLHQPLFSHQLNMFDALEGRKPRDLHPSMTYEKGDATRVLINLPPAHGKTTTISENYVTWLIHCNPNIKIIIVSKTQTMAIQIVGAVKHRLTSPIYRDMHMKFAPEGGWKDPDASWTRTQIYVQGKGDGEKDPTLQALGIGGQIYGARADVIILDDAVTLTNANQYEDQLNWLRQEVDTRLPPDGGLLAILGTRVAAKDLYREIRDIPADDADLDEGEEPTRYFTYMSMPAVLDYGDGNKANWKTLWPRELLRDGTLKDKWTGKALAKKRALSARMWALVYQQLDVADDAIFTQQAVAASINGMRFPGVLKPNAPGHRDEGMSGLFVIGGLDPATVGCTAMIVVGLDVSTGKRYVLDGFNQAGCSPQMMRENVKRLTDMYGIQEWVIERNAFQRFLTQDPELMQFLQSRGCKLTEHYTTANKRDETFGVMGMAPLFESCLAQDPKTGEFKRSTANSLIELPSTRQNAWAQELESQLIVWQPDGMAVATKTDLVMALWFTNIAASRVIGFSRRQTPKFVDNPWLSSARKGSRRVINMRDYRESLSAGAA